MTGYEQEFDLQELRWLAARRLAGAGVLRDAGRDRIVSRPMVVLVQPSVRPMSGRPRNPRVLGWPGRGKARSGSVTILGHRSEAEDR